MWCNFSRMGLIALAGCVLLATAWIGLPASAQAQSISQMCGSDKLLFSVRIYDENYQIYVLDIDTGTRQQLTDPNTYNHSQTWSPDGKQVAFFTQRNGSNLIAIGNIENLPKEYTAIPLTQPISGISWSPDGKYLTFGERQGNVPGLSPFVLVSLNLETKTRITLTDPEWKSHSPKWSPLGNEIVFQRSVGGGVNYIYVASPDGTSIRKVVSNFGGYYSTWSPDGQKIAYKPDAKQTYLMNRDGSNKRPLVQKDSPAWLAAEGRDRDFPAWSPNGKCIVFPGGLIVDSDGTQAREVSGMGSGAFDLQWQPNDQAKRQLVLPTPTAIPTFPNSRFSQLTGKIIYASKRNGREDIYVMDANGKTEHRLTNAGSKNTTPKLSPDGKQIAFVSDRDGRDHIYIMNVDGSEPKRLTQGNEWESRPDWMPDGQQLSFIAQPVLGIREPHFYVFVSLDGVVKSRIQREDAWPIVWSRRGDSYLDTFQGRISLCPAARMVSSTVECLYLTPTNSSMDNSWPTWSPDETQIAFVSDRDQLENIYIMNRDGSNQKPLTFSNFVSTMPTWSPDGQHIAFVSERDGQPQIYIMDRNGVLLGRLTSNNGSNLYPTWIK